MASLSFYDRQHIQQILAQNESVASIFNQFIFSVSPYLQQWTERSMHNVWLRNQSIERNVDKSLADLQARLLANISSFQIDAWKRSDMKNEDFIKEYIKGMAMSEAQRSGLFGRNAEALSQLINKDARGVDLSSRVWGVADSMKTQLEHYLQTGLSVGRGATQIGSDVRQILKEPDKRFRRVKDENGKLVMSPAMAEYHPGTGVYRSARMNALRLTSTSTNMAYRSADYDRWSKQDFVLGIEIHRSANNKGPCKMCDPMVGDYPKDFKFTGFHPFCICFATPKVLDPEDMADFLLTDEIPRDKVVRDIPKGARAFVEDNRERAKGWANAPYFVRDNEKYFSKLETNTYTAEEKKFTRARKTNDAMDRAVEVLSKEYPDMENTQLAAIHYYTQHGGNYRQLNKQLYDDTITEFNEASSTLISSGLSQLPKYEGVVYRGTILKRKDYELLYDGKDEVEHKIFTSSSKEVAPTEKFTDYRDPKKSEIAVKFEIVSKNGRDISKISEFNGTFATEDQKEVLFDNGTRFRIVSIEEKLGFNFIKMEEL